MSKQTDLINIPDAITVDGSNNVGIGSSPSSSSTVKIQNTNDTTHNTLDLFNDNGNRNFTFQQDTTGNAKLILQKNDGTNAVRLDANLGGILFGTDTAAANTLDDYEEGTWTVNITKGGSALPVNTRYAYYTRVGNLIYLSFYWFHNGGLSSETNNSTQYKVIGLPYALQAGISAAYAGIGSTYVVVNGNNVANDYYHKWQVNATDKLSLTGHAQSTQHSSGVLELSGSGVFRI